MKKPWTAITLIAAISVFVFGTSSCSKKGTEPEPALKLKDLFPKPTEADIQGIAIPQSGERKEAGVFSLVLESVPARLAEYISKQISIPTIGIGAGAGCDGQVLVTHDLLGLFDRFTPKFVKQYANFHAEMNKAFTDYIDDVESKRFPAVEHTVEMTDDEWNEFISKK